MTVCCCLQVRLEFEGHQYISLHLRIERDWRDFAGKAFVNGTQIVAMMEDLSASVHLKDYPIYLATGEPDKGIDLLRRFTTKKVLYRNMVVNETLPYIVEAVVDEEICKGGAIVISEYKSTFGLNLWLLRSMLYNAFHPLDALGGSSYSYGIKWEHRGQVPRLPKESACSTYRLLRIGWKRIVEAQQEPYYELTRQRCNQTEDDFVHDIFASARQSLS